MSTRITRRCDCCGSAIGAIAAAFVVEAATHWHDGVVDGSAGELWCSGCVWATAPRAGVPRLRSTPNPRS